MIYITQLIYIREGQEAVFNEFEAVAIPLIAKYNGNMLFRVKPATEAYLESSIEQPYEIHLVSFNSEQDFQDFMHDDTRKTFLHLKEQAIKASILIKGVTL